MKLGSLFDGSGGFPLAGALCGIEPIWASEIEPYPIAVTKSRIPKMKHLGDISKINGADLEPVDIITFGSPCQDLSVAGKRAGLKHENNGDDETTRSGLFIEAVRIIKEMREKTNGEYPRFALWENVPGAFSSNKGEDFRIVLEELVKIVETTATMPEVPKFGWPYADSYCGNGWSLAYRVLDAQYWGVPQRRRRIYLVADFGGGCAREILFEREGLRGYFAKGRTPWEGIAADAERSVVSNDSERNSVVQAVGYDGYNSCETGDKSATLGVNCGVSTGRNGVIVPYTLKIRSGCEGGGKGALIQTDKSATLSTQNDQYLFQPILDDQGGSQISVRYDGKSPTLRAEMHGNVPCVMESAGFCPEQSAKTRGIGYEEEITPTLRAGVTPAIICKTWDARGNGDGKTASTITGDHESRITDYTSIVVSKETVALEGNGQRPSHHGDGYLVSDKSYTLNTTEVHGVAYAIDQQGGKNGANYAENVMPTMCSDSHGTPHAVAYEQSIVLDRAFYNQGQNALYDPQYYEDGIVPPIVAKGPSAVCYEKPPQYIVRRLTPTECARLQGFADRWGEIDPKTEFSDEEYRFWCEVYLTKQLIDGKVIQYEDGAFYTQNGMKPYKHKTKTQMLTWYNKLHTDSAEYKMWGNGIALPTALYVMQGISNVMESEEFNENNQN